MADEIKSITRIATGNSKLIVNTRIISDYLSAVLQQDIKHCKDYADEIIVKLEEAILTIKENI